MNAWRTMFLAIALSAAMATAASAQNQYDQWAGWDSGRADRLAAQSVRGDGAAVRTIQAQPLRGSVDDALRQRVQTARVAPAPADVVVSRYPSQQVVRHASPQRSLAVDVGYRSDGGRSSYGVGVSASSVHSSGYYSNTYYAHPGTVVVHQKQVYRPIAPPIYLYPKRYCAPPPVYVYRPHSYYCPPPSGFSFHFSYRR